MATDSLASTVRHLPSPWHGYWFDSVESTQDIARAAADQGAPSGSLFVANFQRKGRGRQDRTWLAQPGAALLLSILFRASGERSRPWRYTSLAALSLVEAMQPFLARGTAAIKWPNDVMLDNLKVAGILAQTAWNGHDLTAIVGIGLNVAAAPEVPGSTALVAGADRPIDRGELLLSLLDRLKYWLEAPPDELHATWQTHLWARGQRLRLVDLGQRDDVVILGVRDDGALEVQLPDGTHRFSTTGELLP